MKIAIVDEGIDRIGGVERTICTLANKLSEHHVVKVFSEMKTSKEPYYEYKSQITREYLWNDESSRAKKRKKKDLWYYCIRFPEKIKAKRIKKQKIKQIVENELPKYDIILFGRIHIALHYLKYFAKHNIHAKVIVRDAIFLEYYSKKIQKKIKKYFDLFVDVLVISSEESKKSYNRFFQGSKIKIVKIYNPLGINPVIQSDYLSHTIVTLGRMEKQKGYDNLIMAFKLVHKKNPEWKLEFYGDGSYKKKLQKLVKKYHLENSVHFNPSTKNVVEVFNRSALFVMPSRYEGYANTLVEAISCGIPSISYNWLRGVDEIINHKNGMIVKLQDRKQYMKGNNNQLDIQNFAQAINSYIGNPNLYCKISKEAKRIIESRKPDTIIKQWEETLLNSKNK